MKKVEFQNVHPTWIPFINKIKKEMDEEQNLWDREKAIVLLIVAAYFLNKEAVPQKDATSLLAMCRKTIFAAFLS
jgi:hypothetical protein